MRGWRTALRFGVVLAALSFATPAAAQRRLLAARATSPPTIDGVLDEAAWSAAPIGEGFTQKVPHDGQPPTDPTIVRVLYDDDAVYIGVECPQLHTPVTRRLTRRDRLVESDSIAIDLGTRGDHKSAFEFYVNASGTPIDAIRFNDTGYSTDWDDNWEASTKVTDSGWTAELRIPLRVLRFPALPVQSWDFQVVRYISARQETDEWAYFPRSLGGEVSHYGRLDGLSGLHHQAPIELRPFVLGRIRHRDPADGQLASGTDLTASAGLDLKWHPTPDLTLDATIHPDFAQVEADQVVLNVSTYETYYPEKRPFFLESIDVFQTPFQLLYTRRIGRLAPTPALRTDPVNDEKLVDVPDPATIYGAAKLTGRLADKWSIGTIQALTGPNDVEVQLASGARVKRVVDPTSSYDVLRLRRDLGSNAHVGIMATAVTHAESTDGYPVVPGGVLCPGQISLTPLVSISQQVAPSARCFDDAYVGAVDWRWRSPGGDYETGGQVVSSVLERGPGRPIADGTTIHPGDVGLGAQVYVNKEGGKHWVGVVNSDTETRKFTIDDVGYNARANQFAGYGRVEYRELDGWGPLREAHAFVSSRTSYNQEGLYLGSTAFFVSYGRFKNLWDYAFDLHYLTPKFDDREVGDGAALQRAARIGNETVLSTDATKRVAAGIDQTTELVTNGFAMSGNVTLTVRVLPQFDFDVLPTWSWTFGEPRFVPGAPQPGQYLFGKLDAKSVGVTFRTTYTFTPRLTLQGYAQLFLSSGHYDRFAQYQSDPGGARPSIHLDALTPYLAPLAENPDFAQGVLNVNVVLRWEYTLGSTIYLVYTRSQAPTTTLGPTDIGTLDLGAVRRAPASDAILAKITYWWGG